jgi:hypothetical protein
MHCLIEKKINNMRGIAKLLMGVIIFVVIATIAIRGTFVMKALDTNDHIFQINVNSFNQVETYLTKEWTKDEKTGCITFKDEFGVKRIVCNNYTVTEY